MSYERDGYVSPISVLDEREVARFRAAYEDYEHSLGERLAATPPRDRYVFFAEPTRTCRGCSNWPLDRVCSTRLPRSSARIS